MSDEKTDKRETEDQRFKSKHQSGLRQGAHGPRKIRKLDLDGISLTSRGPQIRGTVDPKDVEESK